jgi:low affinity Fe/Cu permease
MKKKNKKFVFESFASRMTKQTGKPSTFIIALCIIVVWAVTGPVFKFSDTWQLIINTGTTIITFLMVFIIQQTQNKDTMAIHLKLNELIAATRTASNRLIDVEDLTEEELIVLKNFYIKLSNLAEKEDDIKKTHSIEDADNLHRYKHEKIKNGDKQSNDRT